VGGNPGFFTTKLGGQTESSRMPPESKLPAERMIPNARRASVHSPAAIAARRAAAVLDVAPFEGMRAGGGDRIALGLPIDRAADAVLTHGVDIELQPVAVGLRGDLPVEGQAAFGLDADRRLHPGLLGILDVIAALGRIAAVTVRTVLAIPPGAAGGVGQRGIDGVGQPVGHRRNPLDVIDPDAVTAARPAGILAVPPSEGMRAGVSVSACVIEVELSHNRNHEHLCCPLAVRLSISDRGRLGDTPCRMEISMASHEGGTEAWRPRYAEWSRPVRRRLAPRTG